MLTKVCIGKGKRNHINTHTHTPFFHQKSEWSCIKTPKEKESEKSKVNSYTKKNVAPVQYNGQTAVINPFDQLCTLANVQPTH